MPDSPARPAAPSASVPTASAPTASACPSSAFSITDLRDAPCFTDIVADRVWRAWWRDKGVPLSELTARLNESLQAPLRAVPSTFVAHRGPDFLGNVGLIARDLDARPALTPWLAALWVEAAARRQGIAQALQDHVAKVAFGAGHARLHLCANPANAPYYARRGWTLIEADVDGLAIFMRERDEA